MTSVKMVDVRNLIVVITGLVPVIPINGVQRQVYRDARNESGHDNLPKQKAAPSGAAFRLHELKSAHCE
ncbi:MAG: hypothetical protein AB7U74_13895 [Afipia sp.]